MEGLVVTCLLASVASALQAAPARDAPTLRRHKQSAGLFVSGLSHIRFLFIVARFRLGLAYRTPPRDDALVLCLTFGSANTWCQDFHPTGFVPCTAHTLFQFALKTITALFRLAVLQHCLRLRALFSFLMQIGIRKQKSPVDRGFQGCFLDRTGQSKTHLWRSGRDSNPRPPA